MVEMLAENLKRDVLNVRLFETGARFQASDDTVEESLSLTLGITGGAPVPPLEQAEATPFYELKGALESLLTLFEAPAPTFSASNIPAVFEPGRAASVQLSGRTIAHFGQLAQPEVARRKLRQPLWLAQLYLEALLTLPLRTPMARELSRFQAVERDFSFTFPDAIHWAQIEAAIRALDLPELLTLQPIEIFRNPAKWPGVYSTLIRARFQSLDRTLIDEELTAWWSGIISALESLGGTIRS